MPRILVQQMAFLTSMWTGFNVLGPICQVTIKEAPGIIPLLLFGMGLFRLMPEHPIGGILTSMEIGLAEVDYRV